MGRIKIPVGVTIFLAIWLAALCVPSVRDIPKSLIVMSWFHSFDSGAEAPLIAELSRRSPNDADGALWAAENAARVGDAHAIEPVIARFPRDMSARALQLKMASSGRFALNIDLKKIRHDQKLKQNWANFAQFARDDAKLEPDNAFWPLMEAAFLYAARRDDAARAVIERAATCARYQDYSERSGAHRVAFLERHRRVLWNTKISIASSTLYPQLAWINQSADLAAKRARALRAAGRDAQALALEAAILRCGFLLKRDSQSSIGALTGQTIARDSLRTFFRIATPKNFPPDWAGVWNLKDYVDPVPHYQQLAGAWNSYARANGQSQLSGRADFVADVSQQKEMARYLQFATSADFWKFYGFSAAQGTVVYLVPGVLFLLAYGVAMGVILWMLTARLRDDSAVPTRGAVVACANFSFWALAGAMTVAWAIFIRPHGFIMGSDSVDGNAVTLGFLALALATWLLPVLLSRPNRGERDLYAASEKKPDKRARWTLCILWFLLVASLTTVTINAIWGASVFDIPLLDVLILVSLSAILWMSWKRGGARSRRKWQLAHRSLGVMLLSWSVIFLMSALMLWPLQIRLSQAVGRQIQLGEIAWMREQVAKAK